MKTLLTTIFTVLTLLSFAQDYPQKGDSEIGFSFGSYSGSLRNGFDSGSSQRSSIGAAVQYEHYFSDRWGIKGKLNYDPKGDGFVDLNYLTIPVMANWHFGKNRRWNLHFGPYIGLMLSTESGGIDVSEFYTSTDGGIDLGIAYKFPIGDLWFFVESDGQTPFSNALINSSSNFVYSRSALSIGVIF